MRYSEVVEPRPGAANSVDIPISKPISHREMNETRDHSPDDAVPRLEGVSSDPAVRSRIIEYLGGGSLEEATCLYLSRCDLGLSVPARHPPTQLDALLEDEQGLARSLADVQSMIIHLDIEYVNFDDPAAAFTHPERAFQLQEPVVEAIEEILLGWGIRPLHVVTGQGHHFVWRIRKKSAVAESIGALGIWNTPELLRPTEPVFPHLALLMEYFSHRIKWESAPRAEVPVEITARHVGFGRSGAREMISIDISEYGDPLDSRMIRIPYTRYRKPWVSGLIDRLGIEEQVQGFVTLPLHEMNVVQLLACRQDPAAVISLAKRAGVAIPLQEKGTQRLADEYRRSKLVHFHRHFYSVATDPPERWPETYGHVPLGHYPGCVRHILEQPNDLLLKPAGMQLVTRALLADGWHPRHIAGLVRSIFENPAFEWGIQWAGYDPVLRAEFYVRLFSGEIVTGLDSGVDFNCTSQQEKGFCWKVDESCWLGDLHRRLYESARPQKAARP